MNDREINDVKPVATKRTPSRMRARGVKFDVSPFKASGLGGRGVGGMGCSLAYPIKVIWCRHAVGVSGSMNRASVSDNKLSRPI
jgi:hypothetical protein